MVCASATSMVASSAYSDVRASASRSEKARRRAAASSVWVWSEVMGGPSQRPVIGPSTERQSRGIGLPPMLRVRLLGELQAEADGEPIAMPPGRRAWALLAWLALHPGEHARGVGRRALLARRARLERARLAAQRAVGAAARARRRRRARRRPRPDRAALRDRPGRVRRPRRGRPAGGRGRAAPRAAAGRPRRRLGAGGARRARRAARRGARAARRGGRPAGRTPSAGRAAGSRSTRSTRTPRAT